MKKLILLLLLFPFGSFSQYGFKKGVREGDAYRMVTNDGIQFNFGATYQITPKDSPTFILTDNSGQRGKYYIDPAGQIGFHAELGMVHFPKWKGKLPIKALKKSRLMDFVDWGIGYKHFRGTELTHLDYTNALGEVTSSVESKGNFTNGFLYGRFSAHSLIYIGKKKIDVTRKYFIDNAIGFNFDYNLFQGEQVYAEGNNLQAFNFHSPLVVQFHYSLGVGIRINRAWMMIPGVYLPLIGIHDYNGINAKMNWFSSTYRPIQAQIKFIKLFERQPKCGAYGDPKDMEKDKGFRMNN